MHTISTDSPTMTPYASCAHVEVFGWNVTSSTRWDVTGFNVGRRVARLAVSAYSGDARGQSRTG